MTTIRTAGSWDRASGMPAMLGGRVRPAGHRLLVGRRILAARAAEPDVRERHRSSRNASIETRKPASSSTTAMNFAHGERTGDAEAVERVARRKPRTRRARSGSLRARGCGAGRGPAPSTAPGSDATKFTTSAIGEMIRLNRKLSPFWFGSSE